MLGPRKAVLRDLKLEESVKAIFGDIADKAYIAGTAWDEPEKNKEALLEDLYDEVSFDCLNVDCKDIIILFKNGNAVYFSNSEWGVIEKADLGTCIDVGAP